MVDRYSVSSSPDTLIKSFDISEIGDYQASYNAGPTQDLPVLLTSRADSIQHMTWGLISKWSNNKAISPKLYNLPVEQAFQKRMYQQGLKDNRCVILADGFYLWKQIGKTRRVPYYFYLEERRPFGIAGLWESYEDMDGNPSNTFIMVTSPATPRVMPYQEDMPLVLSESLLKRWIDQEHNVTEEPQEFLSPTDYKLKFHPVSPLISNLENDHEDLIKASVPSDQHGNYTLFN